LVFIIPYGVDTLKPIAEHHLIQERTSRFWAATIALSLGAFLVFSNLHLTQPILPLVAKEFGVSPTQASLTISLVTLFLSLFLLFFGPLSDAIGRKNVMGFGLFFSSLLSILIFFVPNFETLLVMRSLQGIALASLPAIAYAYIGEEFERSAIGITIGLYISANSLGGMAGRVASGFIADFYGWRFSFLIMGLAGMLFFFLFLYLLPKSNGFTARPFIIKEGLQSTWKHMLNPYLRPIYYLAGIIFCIFMGLYNYLGFYLHEEPYYLSVTVIGLLYITYLAGTFSSTLSGKLSHWLRIRTRILIGLVIILIGIFLTAWSPLVIIILGITLVCFGFFFTHAAATNWISEYATEAKGSASSLYLLFYYIGGSVGSTVFGFFWEMWGWLAVVGASAFLVLLAAYAVFHLKESLETNV
jgi:YNFM family putative membrane transporter